MNEYREILQEAINNFKVIEHLITITYPLINENKLILTILKHLDETTEKAIKSLLIYEKLYKQQEHLSNDKDTLMNIFETIALKHNIEEHTITKIKEIKILAQEYKESQIEFSREKNIVICSKNYEKLTKLSIKDIKKHSEALKSLLQTLTVLQ